MCVSRNEFANIVSDLLYDIDFEMPPYGFHLALEEEAISHFANQTLWTEEQRKFGIKIAKTMYTTAMFYPLGSKTTQLRIGLMTTYFAYMDDHCNLGTSIDRFTENMLDGKPQDHPVLQSFIEFLSEGKFHTSSFVNTMVIQDAINFVAGCTIERDHSERIIPRSGAAKNFPDYIRDKTGIGELYAYFVFADISPENEAFYLPIINDISQFISIVNDILSFYKECIVGDEQFVYIRNLAISCGISLGETLRKCCAQVVENVKNMRTILADRKELLELVDAFINGFIAWHMSTGRYRLHEVPLVDRSKILYQYHIHEPVLNKNGRQFVFENI